MEDKLRMYDLTLPVRPLEAEVITYRVDVNRAKRLASDLVANPGLLGNARNAHDIAVANDAIVDRAVATKAVRDIKITLFLGCAGCGKSTMTGQLLSAMSLEDRRKVRIVSHTQRLRAENKETHLHEGLRGFSFPTIETVLSQPSSGIVVYDDASKFWGGLLDYVALVNPGCTEMVVNGDPGQGKGYIPYAGSQSEYLPTALESVTPYATKYATLSHRITRVVATSFGLHTTNQVAGHITFTTNPTGHEIHTASPRYVSVLRGGGENAKTYDSVQGETVRADTEIDFTGLAGGTTDSSVYVAMSRSTTGVYLHGSPVESGSSALVSPTASPILNSILYDLRMRQSSVGQPTRLTRMAFLAHLHKCMPLFDLAPIGYTADWTTFSRFVPTAHHVEAAEPEVSDGHVGDAAAAEQLVADALDNEVSPRDGESRERSIKGLRSRQFKETATVNAAMHRPSDRATTLMAIEKRLKSSTYEQNLARMQSCRREDMCVMFDLMQPVVAQWADHAEKFMDTAVLTYAESRSEGVIASKLAGHDPDRTGADVSISVKKQKIKKLENLGGDAKAAQLIHQYDIAVTLEERAMWRFLEDMVMRAFGDNVMVFNRESPAAFAARVRPRLAKCAILTGSDATGWDAGCDAGMLNFDLHVMKRAGIPEVMRERYMARRLQTRSQYGVMQTMQNSGDGGTYCMNTIRDTVVTTIRMRVQPHFREFCQTPVGVRHLAQPGVAAYGPMDVAREADPDPTLLVNGDDVLLGADASTQKGKMVIDKFPDSPWQFKDEQGRVLEFSGMQMRCDGSVGYSPRGLWYRCAIRAEDDTTDPIQWRAYADLYSGIDTAEAHTTEVAKYLLAHLPEQTVMDLTPMEFQASLRSIMRDPNFEEFRSRVVAPVVGQSVNLHDR
jgi:hypothetical protein